MSADLFHLYVNVKLGSSYSIFRISLTGYTGGEEVGTMTLLLYLLAALAQAAERPSPVNPMTGVAPDSVASVLVRRIQVSFRSVTSEECTIGQEGAQAFSAAVARASPQPSQRETIPADLAMFILLNDGRSIGVIGGEPEIYGDRSQATFMIDGWNYAFDGSSLRAMHAAMMNCNSRGP